MKNFKRYIFYFIGTIVLLALLQFALVAYSFSPYGIKESQLGLNNLIAYKHSGRFVKSAKLAADNKKYQVYMVGTSRLRDGLNPKTLEKLTGKTGFNYGMSGLLAAEMSALTNMLIELKQPEMLIIGIDYFSFNDNTDNKLENFVLTNKLRLTDFIKLYISSFGIKSSKEAWRVRNDESLTCFSNGFCKDQSFSAEEVASYIQQGLSNMGEDFHPLYNFKGYKQSLAEFEKILAKLRVNGTQAVFFHSPAHNQYFSRLKEIGLYEEHMEWKSTLNSLVLEYGFKIWDFNIKSPATTLAFDKSSQFFNDDLHYTEYFGDIILKTILQSGAKREYSSFGKEIKGP